MNKFLQYNHKTSKLSCLLLTCLVSFHCQFIRSQDEISVRTIIREGDLKKLEKADAYKAEADKVVAEANRLNMEVFTVQADSALGEKAIKKKVAQLESQAVEKQTQASTLYEKANEIRFTVYKQYIDEFWKKNEGRESDFLNAKLIEEQASDNYFQAISYRLEAKKMDAGYAKIEKLNEADNLENQAIQKQVTALGTYNGIAGSVVQEAEPATNQVETGLNQPVEQIPAVDIPETQPDSMAPGNENQPAVNTTEQAPAFHVPTADTEVRKVVSGNITINQSMIDAYNQYIATGQFTDTTLSTGKLAGVTSFDSDRLLELWYEYVYGRNPFVSETGEAGKSDSAEAPVENPVTVVPVASDTKEKEIGIVTDENVGELVPADDEVIYRVQIAANRNELTQRALAKMYYGNKNVEMINENGWYKYSVGDFTSYDEASKFRKASGINNAFVVAYRKGTRFKTSPAEEQKAVPSIYTPTGEQKLPSGLIFRIQVAASRVPLTPGQLKQIYSGDYPVEMISEDGWYKYQFMGVRLYSDALQIVHKVSTPGAFIVAYDNGIKTSLAEAVKNNKELEKLVRTSGRKGNLKEVEFHLQLAASRIALPPDELTALYSGSEPVSIIYEDGWYKYHLKAGNSPETAEQFKQSTGIPKAFIVPYKRAAKIDYFSAMHE